MSRSPKASDLYRSDIDRHLFALEARNRRAPQRTFRLPDWLRLAAALLVWGLPGGR